MIAEVQNENEPTYEVIEPVIGLVYNARQVKEVPINLLYSSTNPASVRLRFFPDASEPTDWDFSRRTLARGFFESHGSGDVRVQPWEDDTVLIQLNPRIAPETQVVLPRAAVESFLDGAYQTVAARDEDELIAQALDVWLAENMNVIPINEETAPLQIAA